MAHKGNKGSEEKGKKLSNKNKSIYYLYTLYIHIYIYLYYIIYDYVCVWFLGMNTHFDKQNLIPPSAGDHFA